MDLDAGGFQGGAFHPDLEGGKSSGKLEIRAGMLVFDGASRRIELPLHDLVLRNGGASDRLVFFSHPGSPECSIYTADRSILQLPELSQYPDLLEQVRRIRKKRRVGRLVTLSILAVLCLGVYGLYLAKDPVVGMIVEQIPASWEAKFGEQVFTQVNAGKNLIENEAAQEELEKLVAPLLEAIGETEHEFQFHIVEDSTINAFAIPGGFVTLHSGLIDAAETPEEILGVLAHEIAHVTRRHSLRQLAGSAGVFLIVQAALGDASGLLGVLMDNGAYLLTQKFSRDHEREADDVGWQYLVQARIDPRGMIRFFERLKEQSGALSEVEESLSFLSTHPATQERIDYLQSKWEALPVETSFRDVDVDLERLKEAIGAR